MATQRQLNAHRPETVPNTDQATRLHSLPSNQVRNTIRSARIEAYRARHRPLVFRCSTRPLLALVQQLNSAQRNSLTTNCFAPPLSNCDRRPPWPTATSTSHRTLEIHAEKPLSAIASRHSATAQQPSRPRPRAVTASRPYEPKHRGLSQPPVSVTRTCPARAHPCGCGIIW